MNSEVSFWGMCKLIATKMLHSRQIKAARGLLRMHQQELVDITGISLSTIKRLEAEEDAVDRASQATIKKIKNALENKGIKFLQSEDGEIKGIGVKYLIPEEK